MLFYSSKKNLDRPNHFGWAPIILVRSKSFWLGPKHFGQGHIRLFWAILFFNLDLSKMIYTRPKQIVLFKNDWYSTKMIWTVQNNFGPMEGQGIWIIFLFNNFLTRSSQYIWLESIVAKSMYVYLITFCESWRMNRKNRKRIEKSEFCFFTLLVFV